VQKALSVEVGPAEEGNPEEVHYRQEGNPAVVGGNLDVGDVPAAEVYSRVEQHNRAEEGSPVAAEGNPVVAEGSPVAVEGNPGVDHIPEEHNPAVEDNPVGEELEVTEEEKSLER